MFLTISQPQIITQPQPQPQILYQGTLKPHQNFNSNEDAQKLNSAMKGMGTNDTSLIGIMCGRTGIQRKQIVESYKSLYGKNLIDDIKADTSGYYEELLVMLARSIPELEAYLVHKAVKGLGTDENLLIEIICTKTNSEMADVKEAYKRLYNKDMESDVRSDLSGSFKLLLGTLIGTVRSEDPVNLAKAEQQAKELFEAGVKRLGTDEATFNRIFTIESMPQLRLVFEQYKKLTGKDIESAIKAEMSGDVKKAFLTLAAYIQNPAVFFANLLHKSLHGLGTKDRLLIRTIILRSERDMVQIKSEFLRQYGKSLESYIKGDTSGNYERCLLCLVGDPEWKN